MHGTTASEVGQADPVKWARLGRDRSLLIQLGCGKRLQLSIEQAAILKQLEVGGATPPRDLYGVIALAKFGPAVIHDDGPVSPAQRAGLSRAIRRLREQGLVYRPTYYAVAATGTGSAIARFLLRREAAAHNVNGVVTDAPLLTLPLAGGIAFPPVNVVATREDAA